MSGEETGRACYTYILRCADGTLYTGWTNDLEHRVRTHNSGAGARYTRSRRPVTLAYFETFATQHEAMAREAGIKRLSRAEKEKLIRRGSAGNGTERNTRDDEGEKRHDTDDTLLY